MENSNHELSKYYTEILGLKFTGNVLISKEPKEITIYKELKKLNLDLLSPSKSFQIDSELERLTKLNLKKEITGIEYCKIKDSNNNIVGGIIKYDFLNDKNILTPIEIIIINSKDYEVVHNVYSEEECNISLKGKYAIKGCISINPFSKEIKFKTTNRVLENTFSYFFSIKQTPNNNEEQEINIEIHKYGKSGYQKFTTDFSEYKRTELAHTIMNNTLFGLSEGSSIKFANSKEKTLKYTYELSGEMPKINEKLLYVEPLECSVRDAIIEDITNNNGIQEIRNVLIFAGLKRDIIKDMIKNYKGLEKKIMHIEVSHSNEKRIKHRNFWKANNNE